MTTLRRVYTTCIITWHLLVIQTMPNLRSILLWWLPPLFYYAHEIFTPLIIQDLSCLYLASHNYNRPQYFNNLKCFNGLPRVRSMTVKEFDLLALDGHNYPTWAVDVKVSLASRGLYRAVLPPKRVLHHLIINMYTRPYISLEAIFILILRLNTCWKRTHEIYGILLSNAMNNKRHLSCLRPTMSGRNFAYRISKLWVITTMLFIGFAQSCNSTRKNLQMQIR